MEKTLTYGGACRDKAEGSALQNCVWMQCIDACPAGCAAVYACEAAAAATGACDTPTLPLDFMATALKCGPNAPPPPPTVSPPPPPAPRPTAPSIPPLATLSGDLADQAQLAFQPDHGRTRGF